MSDYSRPKRELPPELLTCPVHSWRADTGVELIHKEPNEKELDRIMLNWELMTEHQKNISDLKSIELFGISNREHYSELKQEYVNKEKISNYVL